MRKIILAVLLVLTCAGISSAQNKIMGEYNGNDWINWESSKKYAFITGFIAGSDYVIWGNLTKPARYDEDEAEQALRKYAGEGAEPKGIKYDHKEASVLRDIASYKAMEASNNNLSKYVINDTTKLEVIADGLNELYKNADNREIKVSDAVFLVKKQMAGIPKEDNDRLLAYLRNKKQDTVPLFVKDEQELRFITFP